MCKSLCSECAYECEQNHCNSLDDCFENCRMLDENYDDYAGRDNTFQERLEYYKDWFKYIEDYQ